MYWRGGISGVSSRPQHLGGAVTVTEATEQSSSLPSTASVSADQQPAPKSRSGRRAWISAHWREIASTGLEFVGILTMSGGFWMLKPWSGLVVLGVGLIVFGIAVAPQVASPQPPR